MSQISLLIVRETAKGIGASNTSNWIKDIIDDNRKAVHDPLLIAKELVEVFKELEREGLDCNKWGTITEFNNRLGNWKELSTKLSSDGYLDQYFNQSSFDFLKLLISMCDTDMANIQCSPGPINAFYFRQVRQDVQYKLTIASSMRVHRVSNIIIFNYEQLDEFRITFGSDIKKLRSDIQRCVDNNQIVMVNCSIVT